MISKETLILNSIVFKDQMDQGISQADLVEEVASLGLRRFEVRREFLKDIDRELLLIKQAADKYAVALFYSVNEDFLVDGKVNSELTQLLDEAKVLSAPFVKMNTGSARDVSHESLDDLALHLQQSDIGIRLENNQDPDNATITNCQAVMALIAEANLPISFVFDTANWAFLDQDLNEAVRVFEPVTSYLHVKNYQLKEGQKEVASFFAGEIDLVEIYQQFHQLDYFALEYACPLEVLKADIECLFEVLV